MAETPVLTTQPRKGNGSREAQRLRKTGSTPAIVYGHKETPETIAVSREELDFALRHHARMLELQLSGKKQLVLIQDVQYDHLGKDILHADFLRVSATDTIHLTIPVELRGVAIGTKGGGVLIQPLHNLHIECLVSARPESIRVKIDDLQLGQAIHIRELQIPEGVKILHDPEAVVVQVKQPAVVVEPTPGVVPIEGATAEPEVITAKKKVEEGEEE
jgi:large subunit ribosomal protein L25